MHILGNVTFSDLIQLKTYTYDFFFSFQAKSIILLSIEQIKGSIIAVECVHCRLFTLFGFKKKIVCIFVQWQ